MKKFTCREIMDNKGGCDIEFTGDDMMGVAAECGKHVMSTTDEAHKPLHDMMANAKREDQGKWFEWWQGEWNKKTDI